ncbi:hypothetical protein Tco_0077556 [Tanacetum coccineum]
MQLLEATTLIYSMILPRGLSIAPQLLAAIKDSRILLLYSRQTTLIPNGALMNFETLVNLVVETVIKVKHGQDSNIADNLVGIGSQIEEVILMSKLGSMDVADDGMWVVAICGREGVGIL